jgi:hypothetical protein
MVRRDSRGDRRPDPTEDGSLDRHAAVAMTSGVVASRVSTRPIDATRISCWPVIVRWGGSARSRRSVTPRRRTSIVARSIGGARPNSDIRSAPYRSINDRGVAVRGMAKVLWPQMSTRRSPSCEPTRASRGDPHNTIQESQWRARDIAARDYPDPCERPQPAGATTQCGCTLLLAQKGLMRRIKGSRGTLTAACVARRQMDGSCRCPEEHFGDPAMLGGDASAPCGGILRELRL